MGLLTHFFIYVNVYEESAIMIYITGDTHGDVDYKKLL